jgi:hypothetical protein
LRRFGRPHRRVARIYAMVRQCPALPRSGAGGPMHDWYDSRDHTMGELVRRAAAEYGDAPFVVGEDGRALGFRTLGRRSRQRHAA